MRELPEWAKRDSNLVSLVWTAAVYHSVSFQISGCQLPLSTPISAKIVTACLRWDIDASDIPAALSRSARLLCSAASRWRSPCEAHRATAASTSVSARSICPLSAYTSAKLLSAAIRAPGSANPSAIDRLCPRWSRALSKSS